MSVGTVKSFCIKKRFGFIQPESGGKEVFVHITSLERAGLKVLKAGQKVLYDMSFDDGEQSMTIVRVLD
ncbi:MAG: cold shock domain-containing protein [Alphaproteobacteria bacterium]